MLSDSIRKFVDGTHRGVLTTFRRDGAAQMSVITCGSYRDGVAFTTTADRAKLLNLRRDSRCSLLVSQEDWWGYVVLEGHATILSCDNSGVEEYRAVLRDIYRTASGTEHGDWDEYDAAMLEQRRSAIIVVPQRIYGTKA